jgi:hypothetical protein
MLFVLPVCCSVFLAMVRHTNSLLARVGQCLGLRVPDPARFCEDDCSSIRVNVVVGAPSCVRC